jgi:hypothetical protein
MKCYENRDKRRYETPIPVAALSAAALLFGVEGSNPDRGMDVCLLCLYVVLSCVGRGLCDGLITRPEESYRASDCMWLRNHSKEENNAQRGL